MVTESSTNTDTVPSLTRKHRMEVPCLLFVTTVGKQTWSKTTKVSIPLKRMVEWDRKNRVLESWKFKVMQDVAIGLNPLTEKLKWGFRLNLRTLLMRGLDEL